MTYTRPNPFELIRLRAQQKRRFPIGPPPTDGTEAFRQGFGLADNPHANTDPERGRWRADWLEARDAVENRP